MSANSVQFISIARGGGKGSRRMSSKVSNSRQTNNAQTPQKNQLRLYLNDAPRPPDIDVGHERKKMALPVAHACETICSCFHLPRTSLPATS